VQYSCAEMCGILGDFICTAQTGQPFPNSHPSRSTSLQHVRKCASPGGAQRGVQSSSSHLPACPGTRPRRSSYPPGGAGVVGAAGRGGSVGEIVVETSRRGAGATEGFERDSQPAIRKSSMQVRCCGSDQ
jgi:hypothetical protein